MSIKAAIENAASEILTGLFNEHTAQDIAEKIAAAAEEKVLHAAACMAEEAVNDAFAPQEAPAVPEKKPRKQRKRMKKADVVAARKAAAAAKADEEAAQETETVTHSTPAPEASEPITAAPEAPANGPASSAVATDVLGIV